MDEIITATEPSEQAPSADQDCKTVKGPETGSKSALSWDCFLKLVMYCVDDIIL